MYRFCKFIWCIHSVPPNLCQLGHSSSQGDSKLKHKDHSCACCRWPQVRPWSSAASPNVWFDDGSLLEHVGDGVIRVFSFLAWARTSSCKIWLFLIDWLTWNWIIQQQRLILHQIGSLTGRNLPDLKNTILTLPDSSKPRRSFFQ